MTVTLTDLILHIGPPKTGTTTIQNRALSGRPEYLGKTKWYRKSPLGNRRRVRQFRALLSMLQNERTAGLDLRVRRWSARCMSAYRTPQIILSDEDLSGWYGPGAGYEHFPIKTSHTRNRDEGHVGPAPIVRLLQTHLLDAWTPGRVKVVMVFRNQPEWLASLYSQLSNRIRHASQRDFEAQVARIIRTRDPYIDWSAWVEGLAGVLGRENVCVLLMEEMHTEAFWSRLAAFTGIDDLPAVTVAGMNRRAIEDRRSWRLRTSSYWHDPGRDAEIHLTDVLRETILAHVSPYNARFSGHLGRDIRALGY